MLGFLKRRQVPPRPSALTAAQWWANELGSGYNQFRVHDDSPRGGVIAAMGAVSFVEAPSTDEALIKAFEQYLTRALDKELNRLEKIRKKSGRDWKPYVDLWVDYAPEGLLRKALIATKTIELSMSLPTKSYMHITSTSVSVSAGYQAKVTELPVP